MTPYYADDLVTIYHARCEDVLPSIDPAEVGLLLTDPPYGMGYQHGARKGGVTLGADGIDIAGDDEPFDPAHLLAMGVPTVLWGGNHYADRLPASPGWIVWDKRDGRPANDQSDVELAWTNITRTARAFSRYWSGAVRGGTDQGLGKVHVSQKPTALMAWIIERWTEPGDLVLDPYMGSGPVAQACHELGRRYIGIELVEDYCRIAVSRLSQQTFDFGGVA